MKTITIDDELYAFIASQTKHIGESASDILRRILIDEMGLENPNDTHVDVSKPAQVTQAVKEINHSKQSTEKSDVSTTESSVIEASSLFSLLGEENISNANSKVEKFLLILGALHQCHPNTFNVVLDIKGKGRLYFGQDKDTLLKTGSSTNPKNIPGTEFWVVTNNNTDKKKAMLVQAALKLGYSQSNVDRIGALFIA